MKNLLLLIFAAGMILSCNDAPKSADVSENKFQKLLENYYEAGLKFNPISATFAGDNRYNDKFPNLLSSKYKFELKKHYSEYLASLAATDDADLSESEKLTKEVLKWDCEINLAELKYKKDLTPIDQMWSVNLMMGQLGSGSGAQPFETVKDYENWLSRLDEYMVWLASAESNMRTGVETQYVLPKSLIIKVLPQIKEMTTTNLDEHLFYTPIKNLPEGFSSEEKEKLTADYAAMLTKKVIPGYKKLYEFMNTDYLKAGRESSGISDTPDGAEYYQHQIKKYTTTNMTAEEIHELGLKEVARILSEMEKIKAQVGYTDDLKSFFNHVRESKELMPFKTPEAIIANFNDIHEKMKPQLEKLFDMKPKTPFEVKQTEAFRENSASAEYNPGSLDGTRPGIFYTPIPDATKYNVLTDEALFLHEAIPGHHYQISLTQENESLSNFRKTLWNSAYGEGWALYTESLGKELGLYTDPYQYFGMLSMEIHRAIRLVVDTGIHAKGWSREKAIEYSLENEAEPEASIISEIERYMANPGQALSYKIGQLKIRELRSRAESKLGEKFDIRKFHNQVLETGCVPLAVLEDKIDGWIGSF